MSHKIYELDSGRFSAAPRPLSQYKKAREVKLKLLDINMLLMIGKGIRGEFCHVNSSIYKS